MDRSVPKGCRRTLSFSVFPLQEAKPQGKNVQGGTIVTLSLSPRALMVGGSLLAAAFPAMAQDKPVLRFSAVFSEADIRAEMMNLLSAQVADDVTIETYLGGNLFKQGTELVALQRGKLEMGNYAPQ